MQKCLTAFSKNIAKILQVSCGFVRSVRCLAQSKIRPRNYLINNNDEIIIIIIIIIAIIIIIIKTKMIIKAKVAYEFSESKRKINHLLFMGDL